MPPNPYIKKGGICTVVDFSHIDFDGDRPVLELQNMNDVPVQTLGYAFNIQAELCYNEISTLSFDVPKYVDGELVPHYNDIVGMRIVNLVGYGRFILIDPVENKDGKKIIKSCRAYSLEYEWTYKKMSIDGTYNFWNPTQSETSILGIMLSYLPSWSVGSVDDDLVGRYRTFTENNVNIYNFAKSTLQEKYGCIFDFDTYNRRVNVRSTNTESATKPVFISLENLAKSIEIEEGSENIVTVLDVNGADDVNIRNVNPNGSNKIYNLDYFMNESYFPTDQSEMIAHWSAWKARYETLQPQFYWLSIRRMIVTENIVVTSGKLNEMRNSDLEALYMRRSAIVEALGGVRDTSSTVYTDLQAQLDAVNGDIEDLEEEIEQQEYYIGSEDADDDPNPNSLYAQKRSFTAQIETIVTSLKFETCGIFTDQELLVLDRYFKEDAIEDSSFVMPTVNNYSPSAASGAITQLDLVISSSGSADEATPGAEVHVVSSTETIYSFAKGNLNLRFAIDGNSKTFISNDIVAATVDVYKVGTRKHAVASIHCARGHFVTSGEPNQEVENLFISITGEGIESVGRKTTSSTTATYSFEVLTPYDTSTANIYMTEDMSDFAKFSVEWELFEYGTQCLKKLSEPTYTFSVDAANFMALDAFQTFARQLSLGEKVILDLGEDQIIEPILVKVNLDFENPTSLKLEFGNKYYISDSAFQLADLLDQSISMGKKLDVSQYSYESFINSGASTEVRRFMDSALDVARNKVLSSTGQGVSWDSSGLHLRKYLDDSNPDAGFEGEQIAMINNSIVFTDDGWQTAKMAIGKIFDENLASPISSDAAYDSTKTYYYKNTNTGRYEKWTGGASDWATRPQLYSNDATAYGIVAPYIVGTLLAGNNLVIDTDDGSFKVDSSGVHVDSLKFFITHNGGSSSTPIDQALEDAGIKTYYQGTEPTDPKDGDLWYDTSTNPYKLKRYRVLDDTYIRVTSHNAWATFIPGEIVYYSPVTSYDETRGTCTVDRSNPYNPYLTELMTYYYNNNDRANLQNLFNAAYAYNIYTARNNTGWYDITDGDLTTTKAKVDAVTSVSGSTTSLAKDKVQASVNSIYESMTSGGGNVVFDEYGMWLMSGQDRKHSRYIIWMNEKGILFGKYAGESDPSGNIDPIDKTNGWARPAYFDGETGTVGNSSVGTWSTAINQDGVVANSIRGNMITGLTINSGTINGGTLSIGNKFSVDTDGNLTAVDGTFSGVIDGKLKATTRTGAISAIVGPQLAIGPKTGKTYNSAPSADNFNFYVDGSGTVTMSGSVHLTKAGTDINAPNINGGTITGGQFYANGIGSDGGSAYYIYSGNVEQGFISFDDNGAGTTEQARNRVLFETVEGVALKISSGGDISISAGDRTDRAGIVYLHSLLAAHNGFKVGASSYGNSVPQGGTHSVGELFFVLT